MFDSIKDAKISMDMLRHSLEHKSESVDIEVFGFIDSLQDVFDLAEEVSEQQKILSSDEITAIGDNGLKLIDSLVDQLVSQNLDSEKQDVEQIALVLVQWVIDHHGVLMSIQSVVDGLAYLSNAVNDKMTHSKLADFMGKVLHACSGVIRNDLDNSNPSRPWRVLNINRGIVATRSHDIEVMTAVFSELIQAIPMEAPDFFKEGMNEMIRLNYPKPVRELMQEFRDHTVLPSVH